jgi:hypothetical protein
VHPPLQSVIKMMHFVGRFFVVVYYMRYDSVLLSSLWYYFFLVRRCHLAEL